MADEFASQFRRYWLVIVTVVGACTTVFGFQLAMMNQIYDMKTELGVLRTIVEINVETLKAFAAQGPRYTLTDHEVYAREQRTINDEQNRRITVLEAGGR